jgi:ketosteroid isomerase-like protein
MVGQRPRKVHLDYPLGDSVILSDRRLRDPVGGSVILHALRIVRLGGLLLAAACAASVSQAGESLQAADIAFERATDQRGAEGWMSHWAGEALWLPDGGHIVADTALVRRALVKLLADSAVKLRWRPEGAEVARSRDLGYTYGYWRLIRMAAADSQVLARGKYVTIWRRAPTGEWKVALDVGNSVRE